MSDLGPRQPDNDMVICPNCTCQFRAIPVNVQIDNERLTARLVAAERERDEARAYADQCRAAQYVAEHDAMMVRAAALAASDSADEVRKHQVPENTAGQDDDVQTLLEEVEAGCDIQKAHGLYRQVKVIIGPGLTQAEIDRDALRTEVEALRKDAERWRHVAPRMWPRSMRAAMLQPHDNLWACDNERTVDAALAGEKP